MKHPTLNHARTLTPQPAPPHNTIRLTLTGTQPELEAMFAEAVRENGRETK